MFQNKKKIYPPVLPVSLAEHLQILKKMCFICKDKRICDNTRYKEGVIGRCKMNYAKECLLKNNKYYENDKGTRFYEASCRFNILCDR